jgi:endonuclease I
MKISIISLLILLSAVLTADIPNGYYDNAEGLSGTQLRAALHNIIDNHDAQDYGDLHDHYEETDDKPNGKVWDMYSDNPGGTPPYEYNFTAADQCGQYNSEGDCYNREHSWPSSWFNDQSVPRTDMFHVYPTDGYVNSHRGSYPFGEVGNATWTSMNGSKKGSCNYPGYSGTVFEPIDEYKGDFARSYFYMSTRYYTEDGSWDSNAMVDGADLRTWAVNMLAEWHNNDPVSEKELDRNDAVYDIQDNRNPFIDHPEYASLVWGFTSADNYELQISSYELWNFPNPFNPSTTIYFETTNLHEQPRIEIYNAKGQRVKQIADIRQQTSVVWNGNDEKGNAASSGIYYIVLKDKERLLASKKCLMVK